jgi:hypothetical protein
MERLDLSEAAVELDSGFLQWKYWEPHPLFDGSRSEVIEKDEKLIAHGCIWPIELVTPVGRLMCYHLIDWAARRDASGWGVRVARRCGPGLAASFFIGGSAISRKINSVVGFKSYNDIWFLEAPLVVRTSFRNLTGLLSSAVGLPAGWDVTIRPPKEIPECLWPGVAPGLAVSSRSPRLLEHISRCPVIGRSLCCVFYRRSKPMAYLFLIQVGEQLRLADYGPPGLNEETSAMFGEAVRKLGKSLFPSATGVMAATSETGMLAGLLQAGFHLSSEEPIKVLKTGTGLDGIDRFRLTLLDWDRLCR